MRHAMYDELVPYYRLIDPYEEHEDEALCFADALQNATSSNAETLLELGAGAGHNAAFLSERFRCTLTDISGQMLRLSREINPDCEHLEGDMRTMRLGRAFDVVLVHDAVVYMTTFADLRAAAETAFVHTRPGGAALFAPDFYRETFREGSVVYEGEDWGRQLRCLEWMWDPDPDDCTYTVDYAFLVRESGEVRAIHDRHIEGLFPQATWLQILADVGYETRVIARPVGDGETDEVLLCHRPMT